MKVAFRVDASADIGTGHLIRCLTLAEVLIERDVQVQFICREHKGNLIHLLMEKYIPVITLPAPNKLYSTNNNEYAKWLGVPQYEDAEQTIKAIADENLDWLIVDHYGINSQWETQLKQHVEKLLVIDDLADQHHSCNALLNQNYIIDGVSRYQGLVPKDCHILLGPDYALLKAEYAHARMSVFPREGKLGRILIFSTAGDDHGETLIAMEGISNYKNTKHVDVVVGQSNKFQTEIESYCLTKGWNYHCQVNYMPDLISRADLVIGASGANTWERCALGAPALVTILAENQVAIAEALHDKNIIVCLGWCNKTTTDSYHQAIHNLSESSLNTMSSNALNLVDAKGVFRVSDYLISTETSDEQVA